MKPVFFPSTCFSLHGPKLTTKKNFFTSRLDLSKPPTSCAKSRIFSLKESLEPSGSFTALNFFSSLAFNCLCRGSLHYHFNYQGVPTYTNIFTRGSYIYQFNFQGFIYIPTLIIGGSQYIPILLLGVPIYTNLITRGLVHSLSVDMCHVYFKSATKSYFDLKTILGISDQKSAKKNQ